MSYGWRIRPDRAHVKHRIGGDGDEQVTVYEVGKYEVTVPGPEVAVTYSCPSYRGTDPRQTFPNMEVNDGEVRFPIADLVDVVLSRLDPAELAQELWQNPEVKKAFMDALTCSYSERGVGDDDRRVFLQAVQASVHSTALDLLIRKMSDIEHGIARHANHYEEIARINRVLRDRGVTERRTIFEDGKAVGVEDIPLQFDDKRRALTGGAVGELDLFGKCWTEATAYWRTEARRLFPVPPEESPAPAAAGGDVL